MQKNGLNYLHQNMKNQYSNSDIVAVLNNYLTVFPLENNNFDVLQKQLKEGADVLSRENKFGHITTSGIVIHDGKILVIFHKKLQKYIQPGGHFELDSNLLSSAQREVFEETGIQTFLHDWHVKNNLVPININTHIIPDHKGVFSHYHHDFAYVFNTNIPEVTIQDVEIEKYRWVDINSSFDEHILQEIIIKIKSLNIN